MIMAEKIVSDYMSEDDQSFIVVWWIAAAFTDVVVYLFQSDMRVWLTRLQTALFRCV